jgi:hypothetical protein
MIIPRLAPAFSSAEELLEKYSAKTWKTPRSLELVYLPFVLFRYRIERKGFFGGGKSDEGLFLVDLIQGVPMNIRKNVAFEVAAGADPDFRIVTALPVSQEGRRGKKFLIENIDVSPDQVLPAVLEEAEAIRRGKQLLRYDLMRLAGSLRFRKMEVAPDCRTKVLYLPYWLIYSRKKSGEVRFDVIDAVNGQKESGQIADSIKIALVKKARPL